MTDYKRYMGIDYGKKRTGIAVTDPLITFAYSLTTLDTCTLYLYGLRSAYKYMDNLIVRRR